jgi:outer membrane receptor for ferric coprogen and ferric-rhodotorulic acid
MREPLRTPLNAVKTTALAHALRIAMLGMAVTAASTCAIAEEVTANNQLRHFDVSGGALDAVLAEFASQAGITLPIEPGLVQGMSSGGLRADVSVPEGLQQVLKGSGLQAVEQGRGLYLLRPVAGRTQGVELDATSINGRALGMTTEGTGSYTTGATNTATKLNMTLRETPQSVSVMTRQRMDDQALNSLTQVLEQTPGINVQHVDSERFSIYSRGYNIDSFQFDGIPTSMIVSSGATSQTLADMAIYDRIEVLRGASGLLTGAGDPSGTINLVRKRPTADFHGYVSAGAGSWDKYRTEVDVSGPLTPDGRIRGRVVGAYEQKNGFMDHYSNEKQIFYGITEADLTDSTLLTVGVDYQKNDPTGVSYGGFPLFYADGKQNKPSRSFNPAARWSTRQQDSLNVFSSLEQKLANEWSVKLSVNQMYNKRHANLLSLSNRFPDEQTGDGMYTYGGYGEGWQKQTGIDLMAKGPFQLLGREHELVVGLSSLDYKDSNTDDNVDASRALNYYDWDGNADRFTYLPGSSEYATYVTTIRQRAGYIASRFKPTDDLAVILGARVTHYKYDYHNNYPDNPSYESHDNNTETGKVTPYAGIVYDLNDIHSVYASYTNIFKPQTARTVTGTTLDPREGDNYEIGLKSEYFGGRLNTAIALFESRQNNLAVGDGVITGTTDAAYRSVAGAKTKGIEMEASGEILPDWNVSASYSHSITKDADGERLNTVAPANQVKLWSTYRLPGELDKLTLGGGMNWQSGISLTDTPWFVGTKIKATQGDYAVFNAMANYKLDEHISATLNVNNLFDKTYISSMDTNFYGGYYGDPRNVMVTTKYQF